MPTANDKTASVRRKDDRVERVIVGIVLFVLAVVPLLTFLFSFGNVGDLGKNLGVDWRIAYLTGPGVDLTATGMIVAATWLSHRGRTEKELWRIHALSVICALIMFALNCGPAIYAHRYQLGAFNAVGPFLLMAMGYVGPWLLRQLTDARGATASMHSASTPEAETAGSGMQSAPHANAPQVSAAFGNPSAPASASPPNASPAPRQAASTASPRMPRTASSSESRHAGSGPIPIKRDDRLEIVRELIAEAGGDPKSLPLKVIEARFGVSQPTASRMRADAAEKSAPAPAAPAPAATPEDADIEPERAWAVNA